MTARRSFNEMQDAKARYLEMIAPMRLRLFRRIEESRPLTDAEQEARETYVRARHAREQRQRAAGTYPKGRAHGA